MHRGKLREQGTHDQLLAQGGIYARLHALQFSDDPTAAVPRPESTDSAPSPTPA